MKSLRVSFSIIIFTSLWIIVSGLLLSLTVKANPYSMMFVNTSRSHDRINQALQDAQISPDSYIKIDWKQIGLHNQSGRIFKIFFVYCLNSNPNSCKALNQLGPVDKRDLEQYQSQNLETPSKTFDVRAIGSILSHNDVKNFRVGIKLVNQDGFEYKTIDLEIFELAHLIDNNIQVHLDDGSLIEVSLKRASYGLN
jgi:hypothetical protein